MKIHFHTTHNFHFPNKKKENINENCLKLFKFNYFMCFNLAKHLMASFWLKAFIAINKKTGKWKIKI